ncbi:MULTISPECIES: hypothetical protein [Clostridium]|uniref:Uncharacterized protein n=1 Tax=Clostridium frigoriphilum TaxID=443253 RepID=A0ABU7UT12_9CLOT|nr:hypothetical protein [Clostridium sp. DSM 17811]MBU3100647.1 hypothetical protein [Clostridium sp. DSM 17811]
MRFWKVSTIFITIVFFAILFRFTTVNAKNSSTSIRYKVVDSRIDEVDMKISSPDDNALEVFLPLQIDNIEYDRSNFTVLHDSNENGSVFIILKKSNEKDIISITCEVKKTDERNNKLARIEPFFSEKAIIIPTVDEKDFNSIDLSKSIKQIKKLGFDNIQAVFDRELEFKVNNGNTSKINSQTDITINLDKEKGRFDLIYSDLGEKQHEVINSAINKLFPNLITIIFAFIAFNEDKKGVKITTIGLCCFGFIIMTVSQFIQNNTIEFWSNLINYIIIILIILIWLIFVSGFIKKKKK